MGWIFHRGGQSELQFNIGFEGDGERFRFGVAYSIETGPYFPDPFIVLEPSIEQFNAVIAGADAKGLKMWPIPDVSAARMAAAGSRRGIASARAFVGSWRTTINETVSARLGSFLHSGNGTTMTMPGLHVLRRSLTSQSRACMQVAALHLMVVSSTGDKAGPLTMSSLPEAHSILAELQKFHDELQAISAAGNRLKNLRSSEVDHWAARLRTVKQDIKATAKHGTLDGRRRDRTDLEDAFFYPALWKASASFRLRTDAPPSKWLSGLYDPIGEFSYVISNLERHLNAKK